MAKGQGGSASCPSASGGEPHAQEKCLGEEAVPLRTLELLLLPHQPPVEGASRQPCLPCGLGGKEEGSEEGEC